MEKKDWKEFLSVMARLAGEYGAAIDDDNIKLKFTALSSITIQTIKEACTWIIKNRQRPYFPAMPTTSDILDAVKKVSEKDGSAEIELDMILNHLHFFGSTRSLPKELHPKSRYLMTYRWPYKSWASTVLEDDIKWFKRDFKKEFKELILDDTKKLTENLKLPAFELKAIE